MAMRVLFLAILTFALVANAETIKEVAFPLFPASPTPSFDKGYVIAYGGLSRNAITVYSPEGARLYEAEPVEREAGPLNAAVGSDGAAVVAYRIPKNRGALMLLDRAGKRIRSAQTGSYIPTGVCFAPDGFIWTIGWAPKSSPDYLVFRKYSRDLQQIGAFVSRSELSAASVASALIGAWRLRASKDRIGAWMDLDSPGAQAWIELDLDGEMIGKWNFSAFSYTPAAYTPDGGLYANVWDNEAKRRTGLATLDRTTGKWNSLGEGPDGILLGADGPNLVFWRPRPNHFVWITADEVVTSGIHSAKQ